MTKLAISQTPSSITVVDQGTAKVYTVTNTQPNWAPLLDALTREDNDQEILEIVSVKASVEKFISTTPVGNNIQIVGNDVRYRGRAIHGMDVDDLLESVRNNNRRQVKALTAFLENKQLNPSYKAVEMMYRFRKERNMPLTEDGCFLAYKGVQKDYWSKHGNLETIVLKGQVNSVGQILNQVGAEIEVDRKCVEDDPTKSCGPGLHAGSLEYATGWGERVIIVKIHPRDVVSVPNGEDNKMRVCAYTVIGECEGKLPDHFESKLDAPDPDCECFCNECSGEESDYTDRCPCCDEVWDGEKCEECGCGQLPDEPSDAKMLSQDKPATQGDYDDGFEEGSRDGRSKRKRQFYAGDETSIEDSSHRYYVQGYNDGYNRARYGK